MHPCILGYTADPRRLLHMPPQVDAMLAENKEPTLPPCTLCLGMHR